MILHQDFIISIDYNPATDIMQVVYPDLSSSLLPEVKYSLKRMIDAIRNYDVKKLLLDASHTTLNVSDAENKELVMGLATDLAKTRLVKLARIQPIDPLHENRGQENITNIQNAGLLSYQLQTFTNKEEAIKWLMED